MAVVLSGLLDEKQIALNLRARTQDDALREIVDLLQASGRVVKGEKFLAAIVEREHAGSTVADYGIAFPHARTDLVREIVLGIGRSKSGIRFDNSEELVHLIFVIGVPKQMIQDYLVCIGAIARLTKDDSIRNSLLDAETALEFVERLRSASFLLE
jgi:mannitol/fructose-specific phosphotransferase system IIA component (Ntr-type)